MLRDARTTLTIHGEPLVLAGLRYWTRQLSDVASVIRGATGTIVLLAHDPRRLTDAATLNVPLVLSGHTHGGQVVLPVAGAIAAEGSPSWPASAGERVHDIRQPGGRDGLRADADQLPARSRAGDVHRPSTRA